MTDSAVQKSKTRYQIYLNEKQIEENPSETNEILSTMWRLMMLTTVERSERALDLIEDPSFPAIILASLRGGSKSIRQACLETAFQFSTIEVLQTRFIAIFASADLLPELTHAILNDNFDNDSISVSMQLVANLSRKPQFRKQFRSEFDQTVRPTLIEVLGE